MLHLLKTTIRKKKLYFTIKFCSKRTKLLLFLLKNNIITGFTFFSIKKTTFLVVFVNYCYNFDSAIFGTVINSSKVSNQQNSVLNTNFCRSNFVINVLPKNETTSFYKNSKLKHHIKFR